MSIKKKIAGVAAAGALVVGFGLAASPAMADDLDLEITAGSLEWTLAGGGVDFGTVDYSLAAQSQDGSTTFDLSDMTASGDGWVASVQAGAMTNGNEGTIPNTDINFVAADSSIAGAGGDEGGSMTGVTKGSDGDLSTARPVFDASVSNGAGEYTGTLGLSLDLGASQQPGTYNGTLTVTIDAQP